MLFYAIFLLNYSVEFYFLLLTFLVVFPSCFFFLPFFGIFLVPLSNQDPQPSISYWKCISPQLIAVSGIKKSPVAS